MSIKADRRVRKGILVQFSNDCTDRTRMFCGRFYIHLFLNNRYLQFAALGEGVWLSQVVTG